MVSMNTIFDYLFLLSKCGMGYATLQRSVVYMPAYNNNIPYGVNHWLILIYIYTSINNFITVSKSIFNLITVSKSIFVNIYDKQEAYTSATIASQNIISDKIREFF